MSKKVSTTYDAFLKKLTTKQRKQFDKERKEFLISEMILAAMEHDLISVRKLAKLAGVSPTIIQGIRSGTRKNVTVKTFSKILNILGYSLVIEKGDLRLPIDSSSF
jgi:transcriptional regulator with XRE-family HTH domain